MSVPALRFKEFSGDWEAKIIGDFILSHKGGASLKPSDFIANDGFEVIPKKAISSGGNLKLDETEPTYCKGEFFLANLQSVVDKGFLITTLRDLVPSGPSIGYVVKFISDKKYILAQGVYGIQIKKELEEEFLIQYSNTDNYRKLMQTMMVGSTQVHIRNGDFFQTPFCVPKFEEQTKIANFLTAVDEKINLLTQKATLLSQYKKGVMQQIFSQELRFKDDDGQVFPEWEEKTLGEVGENIIGLTYSPKNVTDDKSCPIVLRSSNIKNDMLDLNDQVRVKENIPEKLFTKKDDILICTRNGSQRLIGKNVLISNVETQMTFGAFMSVYRSPFNRFIVHLFKTDNYNEQIQMNLGARINSITTKNLNAFSFWFPSLPEQTKIANFLTAIDEKITNNQTQLNAVKQYKQGLLQQMFV